MSDVDLFGFDTAPAKRTNNKPEADALVEVLKALHGHPAVAWCERMSSGAARVDGRFIRFGFTGCPDVLGMLRDGRLLGVEVKAPKGRLRPEQAEFLTLVRKFGGVAFVARDCKDVMRELAPGKINHIDIALIADCVTINANATLLHQHIQERTGL